MSASERRKGKDFENEVCALLRDRLGTAVRRNLTQVRTDDSDGDIVVGKFSLECKRRHSIAVYLWLDQALKDAHGKIPIVVARADGRRAIAIMELEALLPLIQGEL